MKPTPSAVSWLTMCKSVTGRVSLCGLALVHIALDAADVSPGAHAPHRRPANLTHPGIRGDPRILP